MPALTAQQIIDRSQVTTGDDGTRWDETAVCLPFLNEGYEDWIKRTGFLMDKATLAVASSESPSTAFYTVPAGTVEILGKWAQSGTNRLRIVSLEWLMAYDIDWESNTGQPSEVCWGPWPGSAGASLMRVHPYPTTALSGSTALKVWRKYIPGALALGDTPQMEAEDHLALVDYLIARLYAKDGDFQDALKADYHMAAYEAKLGRRLGTLARQQLRASRPTSRRDV